MNMIIFHTCTFMKMNAITSTWTHSMSGWLFLYMKDSITNSNIAHIHREYLSKDDLSTSRQAHLYFPFSDEEACSLGMHRCSFGKNTWSNLCRIPFLMAGVWVTRFTTQKRGAWKSKLWAQVFQSTGGGTKNKKEIKSISLILRERTSRYIEIHVQVPN